MCRAEAPGVEQFARQHADQFSVVGLGTQDDARQAKQFVERYKLTHTMLWDESFESWLQLGVRGQPAGMLFAADGTLIGRWSGPIPEDDVLKALGTS